MIKCHVKGTVGGGSTLFDKSTKVRAGGLVVGGKDDFAPLVGGGCDYIESSNESIAMSASVGEGFLERNTRKTSLDMHNTIF